MPNIFQTFENVPIGAVPDATNTGGTAGTAVSTVNAGTGSTMEATSFRASHGTKGLRMDYAVGGGAHRLMWNFTEAGRLVLSTYFLLETVPTDFEDVMGVRHASGNMGILGIGSDGKFILNNSAGGGISASRSTNAIPAETWIRVELEVRKGTTTTDGLLGYQYFLGDSTTPVFSWSSAAQNAGVADAAVVFLGRSTGRNQTRTAYYDSMQAKSLASGFIGAFVPPNQPPTAVLTGTGTVEPGQTATLDASLSADPDGGSITYALTETTSGAPATLSGSAPVWTFPADITATGKTRTFSLTVTDSLGAVSDPSTMTVTILPATEYTIDAGVKKPIIWA